MRRRIEVVVVLISLGALGCGGPPASAPSAPNADPRPCTGRAQEWERLPYLVRYTPDEPIGGQGCLVLDAMSTAVRDRSDVARLRVEAQGCADDPASIVQAAAEEAATLIRSTLGGLPVDPIAYPPDSRCPCPCRDGAPGPSAEPDGDAAKTSCRSCDDDPQSQRRLEFSVLRRSCPSDRSAQ